MIGKSKGDIPMTVRSSSAIWLCLLFAAVTLPCCHGDVDSISYSYYPPDAPGPYEVGVTTLYVADESRFELWGMRYRTLPLEIWYPSTGDGGRANSMQDMVGEVPAVALPVLLLLYGADFSAFWNAPTSALRDADVLDSGGPFPVVLFSHGFMGVRFQNFTMAEHLASHGFVVVSVEHYGNAIFVNLPGPPLIPFNPLGSATVSQDRIGDVAFVFGELERMNRDSGGPWHKRLDLDRFAISGHSMGGFTSLAMGPSFDFIKAIAPLAPAWWGDFPQDFSKPFLLLQGEMDTYVGLMNEPIRELWEEAASPRKIYVNLLHGGHYSPSDACALLPPALGFLMKECEPPVVDYHLANEVMNSYMTAFFKSALLGDDRYDEYLRENHFTDEAEVVTVWE